MVANDRPVDGAPQQTLSREDEVAIRSLSEELRIPLDVVAATYARELAPLKQGARVTTFLPLVVSRRVRRRRSEIASPA